MNTATFDRVCSVLDDRLGGDGEKIIPSSNIIDDLGADSLDLMDVTFALENEFGVRIAREELFPEFLFERAGEYVQDGKLTPAGSEKVHEHYRFLAPGEVVAGQEPRSLMTVGVLCGVVEAKSERSSEWARNV
jgi:acyl carrier protein